MEFLFIADKKDEFDLSTKAYVAQICDYAREKLKSLGEICRMFPDMTSNELSQNCAKSLVKGLCSYHIESVGKESSSSALSEALSSQAAFEKLYLKLSGRTQNLFTEIGRHRFAMKVEIDLARFCLSKGDYESAETKLEKALNVYDKQKWSILHTDVLVPLAECQAKHDIFDRYLSSLPLLACAPILTESKRTYYTEELLKLAYDDRILPHTVNSEPILKIEDVSIDLIKEIGQIGEEVSVNLRLRNNLPMPLDCDEIVLGLRYSVDQAKADQEDAVSVSPRLKMEFPKMFDVLQDPDEKSCEETLADRKPGLLKRIRSKRLILPSIKTDMTSNNVDEKKRMPSHLETIASSSTEDLLAEELEHEALFMVQRHGTEERPAQESTPILIPKRDYDGADTMHVPIPERDYDDHFEKSTLVPNSKLDNDDTNDPDHEKPVNSETEKSAVDDVPENGNENRNFVVSHSGLTLLQQSEALRRTESAASSLSSISIDTSLSERCNSMGEVMSDKNEKDDNTTGNQEEELTKEDGVSVDDIELDISDQKGNVVNGELSASPPLEENVNNLKQENDAETGELLTSDPSECNGIVEDDLVGADTSESADAEASSQSEAELHEEQPASLTKDGEMCNSASDLEGPPAEDRYEGFIPVLLSY